MSAENSTRAWPVIVVMAAPPATASANNCAAIFLIRLPLFVVIEFGPPPAAANLCLLPDGRNCAHHNFILAQSWPILTEQLPPRFRRFRRYRNSRIIVQLQSQVLGRFRRRHDVLEQNLLRGQVLPVVDPVRFVVLRDGSAFD